MLITFISSSPLNSWNFVICLRNYQSNKADLIHLKQKLYFVFLHDYMRYELYQPIIY